MVSPLSTQNNKTRADANTHKCQEPTIPLFELPRPVPYIPRHENYEFILHVRHRKYSENKEIGWFCVITDLFN